MIWLVIAVVSVFLPARSYAVEERVFSTYYPSPTGVYETYRLYPFEESNVPVCNADSAGLLYFNATEKMVKVCDGAQWQNADGGRSGYWNQTRFSLFPIDTTAAVAVGVPASDEEHAVPAMLTVNGNIVKRGTSTSGLNLVNLGSAYGGVASRVNGTESAVLGGGANRINGNWTVIAGGVNNTASGDEAGEIPDYASISGGSDNLVENSYSSIGGGRWNWVQDRYSTIAGGVNNTIRWDQGNCTIAGGRNNTVLGRGSTVLGGESNSASGAAASVFGGKSNTVWDFSVVAGGESNSAGNWSFVPGGYANSADGNLSWAGGRRAKANGHKGCFVWADSQDADFIAQANDTFNVRAQNGIYFSGGAGVSALKGNIVSDIAEYMSTPAASPLSKAELAGLAADALVDRAGQDDRRLIGAVTGEKTCSFYMGNPDSADAAQRRVPVSLAGPVYVLVSNAGGTISAGDPITSSHRPGIGMKASGSCRIIGYAMADENFTDKETKELLVFIKLTQYAPVERIRRLRSEIAAMRKELDRRAGKKSRAIAKTPPDVSPSGHK